MKTATVAEPKTEMTAERKAGLALIFKMFCQSACFHMEEMDFPYTIEKEDIPNSDDFVVVKIPHGRCGNPQRLFPGSLIMRAIAGGALEIYMSLQSMNKYISQKETEITIFLSPEKSEELFYDALCNAVGTDCITRFGIELEYNKTEYDIAKQSLWIKSQKAEKRTPPCFEDILMEMLRMGYTLTIIDVDGKGEMTRSITLKDVHDRVHKTPFKHLSDAINETGDVITSDVILQTVFFEKIIFV